MDLLGSMRIFVRVVETGSFTAVAMEQNSSQPTISRQIAALEAHLGARLLARSTRHLSVTDEGRGFLEHARRALDAVSEAEAAVGRRRVRPSGLLRLAVPVVLGRLYLVPLLPKFLAANPDIGIDLTMNDGFSDLVEEGIDLAIRVGEITEPNLVARRIGMTRRVAVASASYLRRRGHPETPDELSGHDCLVYTRAALGARWSFEKDGQAIAVEVSGQIRVNSTEGLRAAVMNGLGIGLVPIWHFTGEIERGDPVVVLQDYEPRPLPMNVVYASRQFIPARVRAMIDFLAQELASLPAIGSGGRIMVAPGVH